jgi:uncharacterized phage-associated protein
MITEIKEIKKVDSNLLAEYILQKWGNMSHLKLQKILFYVEAYHLAYFDNSIIDDNFQAWVHGPVSRKIYDLLKDKSVLHAELGYVKEANGADPSDVLKKALTKDQIDFINETVDELNQFSATQLENMTHTEEPWLAARKGYGIADRCEVIINKDLMKKFYRQEVYG